MKAEHKDELVEKAKQYLKSHYGKDTVSMTVKDDSVVDGAGTLSVDCTVSVNGYESDWSKKFHFKGNEIVDMDARRR
jgi:hypothetical protein